MKIIGFNLLKISVQRKEKSSGSIEIKQNINIDDISLDKLAVSTDDVLKIKFTFSLDYDPDFAKVEFKGVVGVLSDKGDDFNSILKSWKSKDLPVDFRIPLFNFIMNKCNVKALSLEDEVSLPLHLQNSFPKVSAKK